MMINVGLLEQAWGYAQEHPEEYAQDSWGMKRPGQTTHDIAGLALKLLGAQFVWTPVADYPPALAAEAVWGTNDVVFSSLPHTVTRGIVQWVTAVPTDRYADYFWHAVTSDRCPIGLAARIALGIDSSDTVILFEEDAKPGEIARKVAELLKRGRAQWEKAQAAKDAKAAMDAMPAQEVNAGDYLAACLQARDASVTMVEMS